MSTVTYPTCHALEDNEENKTEIGECIESITNDQIFSKKKIVFTNI